MPRRPRLSTGGLVYHVLNGRVRRLKPFERPVDYAGFEKNLAETHDRKGMRVAAYWLIPKHCHLIL